MSYDPTHTERIPVVEGDREKYWNKSMGFDKTPRLGDKIALDSHRKIYDKWYNEATNKK